MSIRRLLFVQHKFFSENLSDWHLRRRHGAQASAEAAGSCLRSALALGSELITAVDKRSGGPLRQFKISLGVQKRHQWMSTTDFLNTVYRESSELYSFDRQNQKYLLFLLEKYYDGNQTYRKKK